MMGTLVEIFYTLLCLTSAGAGVLPMVVDRGEENSRKLSLIACGIALLTFVVGALSGHWLSLCWLFAAVCHGATTVLKTKTMQSREKVARVQERLNDYSTPRSPGRPSWARTRTREDDDLSL